MIKLRCHYGYGLQHRKSDLLFHGRNSIENYGVLVVDKDIKFDKPKKLSATFKLTKPLIIVHWGFYFLQDSRDSKGRKSYHSSYWGCIHLYLFSLFPHHFGVFTVSFVSIYNIVAIRIKHSYLLDSYIWYRPLCFDSFHFYFQMHKKLQIQLHGSRIHGLRVTVKRVSYTVLIRTCTLLINVREEWILQWIKIYVFEN
jgi:hypothetical protein